MIKEAKKGIDRTIAPKIVDAVDFDLRLKPYQKYILKNGVEVYAIDAGAEEVMMVEWVYYAGDWYEEKNLVAAATNFMLKNGTSSKTHSRSMSILNITGHILIVLPIMKLQQ